MREKDQKTVAVDGSIFKTSEDKNEERLTISKRVLIGFIIALVSFLIGIIFWEDIRLGMGVGVLVFVFTVVFGEKYLKILKAVLRITGPI